MLTAIFGSASKAREWWAAVAARVAAADGEDTASQEFVRATARDSSGLDEQSNPRRHEPETPWCYKSIKRNGEAV